MQEEWRREGRVVSQRNILFLLSRHNQLSSGEAIGAGYQMLVFIKPFPGAALRGGWGGGVFGATRGSGAVGVSSPGRAAAAS